MSGIQKINRRLISKNVGPYRRNLVTDRRGNISVIAALVIVPLIGIIAFAVELGNVYASRVQNQAVADSSAYSAALYYSANQTVPNTTSLAKDVALAAGYDVADVSASVIPSPGTAGAEAVQVSVTSEEPFVLARVIGAPATMSITSEAIVEISSGGTPACIIALGASGTGVSAASGASIDASECGIATNGGVSASGNATTIAALGVDAGGSISTAQGASITTNPSPNNTRENVAAPVLDPYDGFQPLTDELANVGNAQAPSTPSIPSGNSLSLTSSSGSFSFQGQAFTRSGGWWVAPPGRYEISSLTVLRTKLRFQSPVDITISGSTLVSSSAELEIGDGSVESTGSILVSNNSQIAIGDGRHYFDEITASRGNITIGDGDIDIAGNITVSGGRTLSIGQGEKRIGGNISLASDASLILGDGPLSISGSVSIASGSTLTFGDTPETYIDGSININTGGGSATVNFGSGRYYIGNNINAANGATFVGQDINFFVGGSVNLATHAGSMLSTPSNDGQLNVDNILFATTSGNINLSTSANLELDGSIYAPNGSINLAQGSSINANSQSCTMLIADSISVATNATINTQCPGLSDDFNAGGVNFTLVG